MIPPWQTEPEAPKPAYIALVTESTSLENPLPYPEPGSPLDYALKYAALGWRVFPVWGAKDGKCRCGNVFCKSPGKHPVGALVARGMEDATTDPAIIRRWWTKMPDAGIGINLGLSGLVCIDQDPRNGSRWTMEILQIQHGELVSDVFAWTQGGGTHHVFSLASDTALNLPGKLGDGVDVKRNGYIVVEPTVGPLGAYSWDEESNPLQGAIPSPLPDWIRDLAAPPVPTSVASVASRYATQGQLDELRDALSYLDADDRDRWIKFGMALRPLGAEGWKLWDDWSKKSDKYSGQDANKTWTSFKPVGTVNFESIFYAAGQAGWINPLAGQGEPLPQPVPVESVRIIEPKIILPSPEFKLPGILGQIEDWINVTSRKPQPMFAIQASLAFGATILGRRYVTNQRNWPSLYFLNIGKSASGKEHGKWAIEELLIACSLERLLGPSAYTSNSGVISALLQKPSHIAIIDEFGKMLEASSFKNSARAATALTTIMEIFGRCDGVYQPQGYSTFGMLQSDIDKLNARCVRNPALTMLAMTTPESFFSTIASSSARDGFLNRILIVESDIGRQPGTHVNQVPIPNDILEWAAAYHSKQVTAADPVSKDLTASMAANAAIVHFEKNALGLFKDCETECIRLMDDYEEVGMAEMFGRTNEIAMRMSLILALGCQAGTITADHAQWAIGYTMHHAQRTVNRLQCLVADSDFESLKKQVLNCIIAAKERGLSEWEIEKKSNLFRAVNQRGQMDVLNSLKFVGRIDRIEHKPSRGPKRIAWVATNPEDGEA